MKTAFLKTPVEPELLAAFWTLSAQNDVSPSVLLRQVVHHVLTHAGHEVDDYDPATERTNDHAQWARRRRDAKHRHAEPVLKARVSPGLASAFARFASARNLSGPATLKLLIEHCIRSADIDVAAQTPPEPPPLRAERLTVRLSTDEMEAARSMAQEFGSVREWAVACLQSKLHPGQPLLTANEVEAVYASNRALWSIGHNVNQIARAINLDMLQAGRMEGSAHRVRELEDLKATIDAHTQKVMALCNASFARWSDA